MVQTDRQGFTGCSRRQLSVGGASFGQATGRTAVHGYTVGGLFGGTAEVKLSHVFTGHGWTATLYEGGGILCQSRDLATIGAMRFIGAPTGTGG